MSTEQAALSQLLPSIAASMGVPGFVRTLPMQEAKNYVLVLVDGLGSLQLERYRAHAPFLAKCSTGLTLHTSIPSTTTTALTTMATGVGALEHGMSGYDVYAPQLGKVVNLLGQWEPGIDPEQWQRVDTVFEKTREYVRTLTVSQKRFAQSPLTQAALRGPEFHAGEKPGNRVTSIITEQSKKSPVLIYSYWNELDKAGHRYGVGSTQWLEQLEDLDFQMRSLAARKKDHTAVYVTGDHGMVNVSASGRIDYSQYPQLIEHVAHTGGEPRFVQLYLDERVKDSPQILHDVIHSWQQHFGDHVQVFSKAQALSRGFFGATPQGSEHHSSTALDEKISARIGDVIIAAMGDIALYDLRRVNLAAMEMVGHHGSITDQEVLVPLLNLDAAR